MAKAKLAKAEKEFSLEKTYPHGWQLGGPVFVEIIFLSMSRGARFRVDVYRDPSLKRRCEYFWTLGDAILVATKEVAELGKTAVEMRSADLALRAA